jgi:hypothetical protein
MEAYPGYFGRDCLFLLGFITHHHVKFHIASFHFANSSSNALFGKLDLETRQADGSVLWGKVTIASGSQGERPARSPAPTATHAALKPQRVWWPLRPSLEPSALTSLQFKREDPGRGRNFPLRMGEGWDVQVHTEVGPCYDSACALFAS